MAVSDSEYNVFEDDLVLEDREAINRLWEKRRMVVSGIREAVASLLACASHLDQVRIDCTPSKQRVYRNMAPHTFRKSFIVSPPEVSISVQQNTPTPPPIACGDDLKRKREPEDIDLPSPKVRKVDSPISSLSEIYKESDCGICLLDLYDGQLVHELSQCRHVFHLSCLHRCLESRNIRNQCPKCFVPFTIYQESSINQQMTAEKRRKRLEKRMVKLNSTTVQQVVNESNVESSHTSISTDQLKQYGEFLVHSHGSLDGRPGFHTKTRLYPLGYKIEVPYISCTNPREVEQYYCEIHEKSNRPLFKVTLKSDQTVSFEGVNPEQPWLQVKKRIDLEKKKLNIKGASEKPQGVCMFGLLETDIIRALESLPGVDQCTSYSKEKSKRVKRKPFEFLKIAVNEPAEQVLTEEKPVVAEHDVLPYVLVHQEKQEDQILDQQELCRSNDERGANNSETMDLKPEEISQAPFSLENAQQEGLTPITIMPDELKSISPEKYIRTPNTPIFPLDQDLFGREEISDDFCDDKDQQKLHSHIDHSGSFLPAYSSMHEKSQSCTQLMSQKNSPSSQLSTKSASHCIDAHSSVHSTDSSTSQIDTWCESQEREVSGSPSTNSERMEQQIEAKDDEMSFRSQMIPDKDSAVLANSPSPFYLSGDSPSPNKTLSRSLDGEEQQMTTSQLFASPTCDSDKDEILPMFPQYYADSF